MRYQYNMAMNERPKMLMMVKTDTDKRNRLSTKDISKTYRTCINEIKEVVLCTNAKSRKCSMFQKKSKSLHVERIGKRKYLFAFTLF